MDRFLSRALGASVLLVAAGVFYYFVVYRPSQDQRLLERSQQRDATYKQCTDAAEQEYAVAWASMCKTNAANQQRILQNCAASGPVSVLGSASARYRVCEQQYGRADSSPNCELPNSVALEFDNERQEAMKQCLAAKKLGP